MSNRKEITLEMLRKSLRGKGWSLRTAARELGVDFSHLHRVLTGERHSASLLTRIAALTQKEP